MKIVFNKSMVGYQVIFILLFFQEALLALVPNTLFNTLMSYLDELVTIALLIYLINRIFKRAHFENYEKKIMKYMIVYNIIGLISTMINKIQPVFPTGVDWFTCNKYVIAFISMSILIRKKPKLQRLPMFLNRICRISVFVHFFLLVVNAFVYQIFPVHDYRYFIYSQKLFYTHPTDLAYAGLLAIIILLFNSQKYKNDIYMVMGTFIVFMTMRTRIIAVVILIWVLYLYFIKMKIKSKALIGMFSIAVVVSFGLDQFTNYYSDTAEARTILTNTSIIIANDNFPFGTGYATYGSNMSNVYYSPLYYQYGFNKIWGLNLENKTFIMDTFWPTIIAQFGWIGFIMFLIILFTMFRRVLNLSKTDKYSFLASLILLLYEFITSLGESALFHPLAVLIFMLLAIFMHSKNMNIDKSSNLNEIHKE